MADLVENPGGGLGGIIGSVKKAFNGVITTMSETGGVTADDVNKAFKEISDKGFGENDAMKDLTPGHGQHIIRGNEVHKITKSREIVVGADDLLHVLGQAGAGNRR